MTWHQYLSALFPPPDAMAYKRKRTSGTRRVTKKRRIGTMSRSSRKTRGSAVKRVARSVKRLTSMIETKESVQVTGTNLSLPHNNIYETGLNPFSLNIGTVEPMAGTGNRVGDKISLRGFLIKGFMENALGRCKVHYRIMLVRGAKGETFNRTNLFKNITYNKIIDQMNTERFSIVASKKFTIGASNSAAATVSATGVPLSGISSGVDTAGQGTRAFSMWIPGAKFGRGGNIQYENQSTNQVKFYDYRIVILAYDWYGTPQDINNVGKLNEMYCKMYFKDA